MIINAIIEFHRTNLHFFLFFFFQLVVAQSESVLSRFIIKPSQSQIEYPDTDVSTSRLLERAYAESALENPKVLYGKSKKTEKKSTKSVAEIRTQIKGRINKLKELNRKHFDDIDNISMEMQDLEFEGTKAGEKAPKAAKRFKFYQEIRGYTKDFEECMNVKVPLIEELEAQAMAILSKHSAFLIERRRQDIRDQAKEMAEATSEYDSFLDFIRLHEKSACPVNIVLFGRTGLFHCFPGQLFASALYLSPFIS